MVINLEISVGKGDKAKTHTCSADGDDMPLVLLEALQKGDAKLMREGIADFLDLPDDIATHLTVRHVKQIGDALKAAGDVPKE